MDAELMKDLVARARKDPAFFHKLVWQPQGVIEELKEEVPQYGEGAVAATDPARVLDVIFRGPLGWRDVPSVDCGDGPWTGSSYSIATHLTADLAHRFGGGVATREATL